MKRKTITAAEARILIAAQKVKDGVALPAKQKHKRLTPEEGRAALAEKPKRSKYQVRTDAAGRAARTMLVEGKPVVFDSLGEMTRWCELVLLEKAKQIRGLERQRTIILAPSVWRARNGKLHITPGITWRADFKYLEKGKCILEDFKGAVTATWKLKLELILHHMAFDILRISHADGTREDFSR